MMPIWGTGHYRVGDPHALVEHCQLIAWLPYLTNFTRDIHFPHPEDLDTTLAILKINKGAIEEAEQFSGLHLF
jgi:hypothetical protein